MATKSEPRDRVDTIVEQLTEAPEKARAAASAYLESLVQQSGGEITPEILQEADRLYDADVPRLRTALAKALGMPPHQLREALARRRQITCEDCGTVFSVIECRRIGGYKTTTRTLCEKCDRRQHDKAAASWAEKRAQEEREFQHRIEVDGEILDTVALKKDPLSVEPLRERVIRLALGWIALRLLRPGAPQGHYVGHGCMICNRESVNPFILDNSAELPILQDSELWKALRERVDYSSNSMHSSRDYDQHPWSPLVSVYQAIWRISLYEYWSLIPFIPLCHGPILMLCNDCGPVVAETHRKIDLGEVHIQRETNVIAACGVQLALDRQNVMRWVRSWW